MDKKIMLWVLIGVLFIFTLFLTFKAGAGSIGTAQAVSTAASSSSGGMVGGC